MPELCCASERTWSTALWERHPSSLEGLEDVTPDIKHIHPRSGHFIQEEEPEWCAEHICRFLEWRFPAAA
jgi:hypothetical protein